MEDIEDIFLYSPYPAAIVDKDEVGQKEFFERFSQLPQPVKDFVASSQLAERIQALFASGIAPEGYELAIAKIVMFIALGDVSLEKVAELLMKLGISPEQSQAIGQAMGPLVQDLEKARHQPPPAATAPQAPAPAAPMAELPPMTRPSQAGAKPLAPMQKPAPRNIIDLRKQQ